MPSRSVLSVVVAATVAVGLPGPASACGGEACVEPARTVAAAGPLAVAVTSAWDAVRHQQAAVTFAAIVDAARRSPTTPSVPARPTWPGMVMPV